MQASKAKQQVMNESTGKAIKRAREQLKLSRYDLARRINIGHKTIEKYENGRKKLGKEDLKMILEALNLSEAQFKKAKKGKSINPRQKEKKVLTNRDRRSYQKNITKECKVLKSLRKRINISQDKASEKCGYSRPTIGHIENGRIELPVERIRHIVNCYGFSFSEFEQNLDREAQRDEIIDSCVAKIQNLSDEKLNLLKGILENF